MIFIYSGKTDIGLERHVNQDSFGNCDKPWGSIYILSDGFGHKTGGKLASQATVDKFLENFNIAEPASIKNFIDNTFDEINKYIYFKKVSTYNSAMLGCTAVVLIITDGKAYIAHIGDSRGYLVRNEKIFQLTNDHSYVQSLIDKGELTREKAKSHMRRHVLVRALGSHREIKSDYTYRHLKSGDIFMLCCDGVWGYSSIDKLNKILIENDPNNAVAEIIESVKKEGGLDNITVQIIKNST